MCMRRHPVPWSWSDAIFQFADHNAIIHWVQVLPLGASKGSGVQWLLDHMGVDPAHVMALGE
jgi:hydroxymethylpyrimidine pyrophosphatase-like HAD family hydrolase